MAWRTPGCSRVLATTPAAGTTRLVEGPQPSASVLSSLRGRGLQLIGLTTVVLTVGHDSAHTDVVPLLLRSGVEPGAVSLVLLGYGVAGSLGLLLAGAFADRHPVASLRTAITAIALAALAVPAGGTSGTIGAVLVWKVTFSAVPTLLNTAALGSAPSLTRRPPSSTPCPTSVSPPAPGSGAGPCRWEATSGGSGQRRPGGPCPAAGPETRPRGRV